MAADTLSLRALNRALLDRQWLLRRAKRTVPDALEHLVGMQAQAPLTPYVGLWTRLQSFHPNDLADWIRDRRAVRLALMRSTIHLVTARDAVAIRSVLRPMLERALHTASPFGKRLPGVDLQTLAAKGRAVLDEGPLTLAALGAKLHAHDPAHDAEALAQAIRAYVPLVQIPPRGVWGEGGLAMCATLETWLGRPAAVALDARGTERAVDALVMRYLGAFGPATTRDAQVWSGLTQLRASMERLRPQLRVFRDPEGRELFDLPDARRPREGIDAPPRFVPMFDNVLMAHADRTRILPGPARARVFLQSGRVRASLLIDGFVQGAWEIAEARDVATLKVESFVRLAVSDRNAIADEGAKLLAFAAPDAAHDVQFVMTEK